MEYHQTLSVGSDLIGEFRILGVLGSGGFANTYLASETALGRQVAIKEFFPSELAVRSETSAVRVRASGHEKQFRWGLERFVREAKTLAKFRHPNIVRVFRVFEANDTAYISLEYVKGADLERWLVALGRAPTQTELDELVIPLLDALEVVHGAGILHRDVKPANTYIRESDKQPVLIDFGAARFAVGEFAGTTAAIVSKGYSPHEAYATDPRQQGPWTDIYGLAATIYRALTGTAPPESTSRVLDDDLAPCSHMPALSASYRPEFLAGVDAGLALMPKARPPSIASWRRQMFPTLVRSETEDKEVEPISVEGRGGPVRCHLGGPGHPGRRRHPVQSRYRYTHGRRWISLLALLADVQPLDASTHVRTGCDIANWRCSHIDHHWEWFAAAPRQRAGLALQWRTMAYPIRNQAACRSTPRPRTDRRIRINVWPPERVMRQRQFWRESLGQRQPKRKRTAAGRLQK